MRALEITNADADEQYYWIEAECTNCGKKGSLAFWQGSRVEEHTCPRCNCPTLHRLANK